MSQDANNASEKRPKPAKPKATPKDVERRWFTTPPPIKRLFDRFPLVTYPSNELPQRTAGHRDQHALYIFTTEEGVGNGSASFNPGCLKWQAYLRFSGLKFVTIPSDNHASPTGALPFLLPSASSSSPANSAPVPSNRIERWVRELGARKDEARESSDQREHQEHEVADRATDCASNADPPDMRKEAYRALLDHRIRNAYLYSLYLSPANFDSVARPLYINSNTSNTLVRLTLSYQLRAAAQSELLKQSAIIDGEAIYRESDKAFEALSDLLGEDEYFFGTPTPGLFDASVFAYTNVLLDEGLVWKDRRMKEGLRGCQNLVALRRRILNRYFK